MDVSHSQIIVGNHYDITAFGAVGDGKTLATPAINNAITVAHDRMAAASGFIFRPALIFATFDSSCRAMWRLYLEQGATILAAQHGDEEPRATIFLEANAWDKWQDFGLHHCIGTTVLFGGRILRMLLSAGPGLFMAWA